MRYTDKKQMFQQVDICWTLFGTVTTDKKVLVVVASVKKTFAYRTKQISERFIKRSWFIEKRTRMEQRDAWKIDRSTLALIIIGA